jgi:sec-independent protein translocase protein TatB
MFFDIGWSEFMVIGAVALVVIGPKDLPAALRVAGYWVRKARTLSREFHSSVEQMMREVELHEVQAELRKATDLGLDQDFNKIGNPAAETKRQAIPDYVDTTPAPVIDEPELIEPQFVEPVPMESTVGFAEPYREAEEPELPLTMPAVLPTAGAELEQARTTEPTKP